MHALTYRQAECLKYLEDGLSQRQIAGKLGISQPAVSKHLRNAREQLAIIYPMDPQTLDNIDPARIIAAI